MSAVFLLYICRLRGHRDQLTSIRFLKSTGDLPSTSKASTLGFLLTTSKDTFMKLWDLSTQHCIQTLVAHRSDIWAMDLHYEQNLIFTGSGEGELKAWKIDREALSHGLKETESGEVCRLEYPLRSINLKPSTLGSQNDTTSNCFPFIIP